MLPNEKKTYYQAKAICANDNAVLAMFKTQDELDKLEETRDDSVHSGNQNMWIGLQNTDSRSCNNWGCHKEIYWSDGSDYERKGWHPSVSASSSSICMKMKSSYSIEDDGNSCGSSDRPFLCEYTGTVNPTANSKKQLY